MFHNLPDTIEKIILTEFACQCTLSNDYRSIACVSKQWNTVTKTIPENRKCFPFRGMGVSLCGVHEHHLIDGCLFILTHIVIEQNPIHIHHLPMLDVIRCVHLLRHNVGVRLSIWHFCCSGSGICIKYDPPYELQYIDGMW